MNSWMKLGVLRFAALGVGLFVFLGGAVSNRGVGLESAGNTDGVLTWQLGTVEPGKQARGVVFFVFDRSVEAAGQ